jgi:hypothetical protein
MAVTFMKRGTFLLALLCANSLVPGIARSQPALWDQVEKDALKTYKGIHAAPELSHFEEKTAALVANELKAAGCEVFSGIGKFTKPEWKGHGVAGVLKNGNGPVVLIRAELDALPITERTGLEYASKDPLCEVSDYLQSASPDSPNPPFISHFPV